MTPYTSVVTRNKAIFNRAHGRTQGATEHAFVRLKAQWRCLANKLPVHEENLVSINAFGVILHNVCEERGHQILFLEGLPEPAHMPTVAQRPARQEAGQHQVGSDVRAVLTWWLVQRQHH